MLQRQFLSSNSTPLHERVLRLEMPPLSEGFTTGVLTKWGASSGQEMPMYGVVFNCLAATMTDELKASGKSVDVVVETLDEGFLSDVLVEEGEVVAKGHLLAVLVEDESDLEEVNAALATDPEGSAFNESELFKWQAFLPISENYNDLPGHT